MEVKVFGKNIEVTDALRQYAEKKVGKIGKFFAQEPPAALVTLSVERGVHVVDITISINGLLLRGEEKSSDMYSSVDGAVEKIERQIHKYKTRINRKLREDNKIISPTPKDTVEVTADPKIVRTKRFAIKPMSAEEAVMQMELLGHDFFVFFNPELEEVNVVYKRKDGNYGLIEPEF
ncbi:MAG TPA: ribosome-associated translation inhibitor RaiA [Firmicutes bacterium]|nr:ribosome-associated translation inhibitor RaiA [Bacillota bacterium]